MKYVVVPFLKISVEPLVEMLWNYDPFPPKKTYKKTKWVELLCKLVSGSKYYLSLLLPKVALKAVIQGCFLIEFVKLKLPQC